MKAFDPNHPLCIFPKYGACVDTAMRAKNLSATDVAKSLGIDPSVPSGWRRGFGRNRPSRTAQLEMVLGTKLDMSEPVPSVKAAAVQASSNNPLGSAAYASVLKDAVLPHLEAIAIAHGYKATFVAL